MRKSLKTYIEYLLCVNIIRIQPVSGGDISQAYLLYADSERFFCKVNTHSVAFAMFEAEKAGLEAITLDKTIATPKVLLCEKLESGAFLLMEYIEPKKPTRKEMELFGHQLALLHQLTASESFGWKTDNFIGSLPQSNRNNTDWSEFYVEDRLWPQLKIAKDAGLLASDEVPSQEQLLKTCKNLFPKVIPSLLHGDLWGGNYLISDKGTPYLIDPAIYYGHYEVDIAMTKLFGGFDNSFYDAYQDHFKAIGGEDQRKDIYQLYYLLVHLNLFGGSYFAAVTTILKRYF